MKPGTFSRNCRTRMNFSTSLVDIRPDHFEIVQNILRDHLPDGFQVWVFGSRVKWTTKDSSDLDLAVEGPVSLNHKTMIDLEVAFEDSDLPYTVDIVDMNQLSDSFRRIVEAQKTSLPITGTEPYNSCGWREVTLGECAVINDFTYSPKEEWPFINYLDTGSITENRISNIQRLTPGKDKIPSRARRKVKTGDVVYSTVRPNQRHFGLLKNVPQNFLASTGFAVIRGIEGIAETDFIYWFLAQNHIVEYLHAIAEDSVTAYPSIKPSDIEQLTLRLPSLPEQHAIAHVLGTLDDKIELNRRMNETLEDMVRALFKSWFVDFDPVCAKMDGRWRRGESLPGLPAEHYDLFPDRLVASELGEIPEGWEVKTLGNVTEVVGGTTPSTKVPEYWDGGIHCWATPKDLSNLSVPVLLDTERRITDSGLDRIGSGLLPKGTVLLSSRAPIGYLAISEVPVAINQGFIAMPPSETVSNLFLLQWCNYFHEQIINYANGSTFLEISKRDFRLIPIAMPEEIVMNAFDRNTRPLYERIVSNERMSRALSAQRDALLPKLVSGELSLIRIDNKCL